MTKPISQREARRLRRQVKVLEEILHNAEGMVDRIVERRHISTWTSLPPALHEEIRIITRAGFRVEIRNEGDGSGGKIETWAVRRR